MTIEALQHLRDVLATIRHEVHAAPEVQEIRRAAQRYLEEAEAAMSGAGRARGAR